MDLYKLPKDMLVKLVAEIREDVREEYEEKLSKVNDKIKKAEEAGMRFYHCDENNCEKYYAMTEYGEMHEDFYMCNICDQEFCDNHTDLCEHCDVIYCQNCYEKHLTFCKICNQLGCEYNHQIECSNCVNKTQICNTNYRVLCDDCLKVEKVN